LNADINMKTPSMKNVALLPKKERAFLKGNMPNKGKSIMASMLVTATGTTPLIHHNTATANTNKAFHPFSDKPEGGKKI